MATRTVRLDDETEAVLREILDDVDLPISEVLKRGVRAVRDQLRQDAAAAPYDLYRDLDLGPGGSAIAPASAVRRGVRAALKRKLHR